MPHGLSRGVVTAAPAASAFSINSSTSARLCTSCPRLNSPGREYPDLETAFRALGKIAKLELFETETFPAEDVKVFWKELV